ncbi:metalloprotease TIKI1-like, partial [Argonauta hians]
LPPILLPPLLPPILPPILLPPLHHTYTTTTMLHFSLFLLSIEVLLLDGVYTTTAATTTTTTTYTTTPTTTNTTTITGMDSTTTTAATASTGTTTTRTTTSSSTTTTTTTTGSPLPPPAPPPIPQDNAPRQCQLSSDPRKLNSFLWRLHGDTPSYLFGTIHVPYTKVWDFIPDNTKKAFQQADYVFFELDLTDPYTISALAKCQLLPHGENLSNVLPRDIYLRLKNHLDYIKFMMPEWLTDDQRGRGLYADYLFNAIAGNWERKRPVWIMLMVNSLTESDIKARGVPVLDLYLAQEAERLNKINGAVEKVEEQCVPLNELNFSQVLFALNQTLRQHETYRQNKVAMPYTTDHLVQQYNCGDLSSIIFNQDTTSQFPPLVNTSLPLHELQTAKRIDTYFRNELIHKRNERMATRVVDLIQTHPKHSFFFAFGAGHFMGNHTVIDHLRKAGFVIEHTSPEYLIPDHPGKRSKKNRRRKKLHLSESRDSKSSENGRDQIHHFIRNRQRSHKSRHHNHHHHHQQQQEVKKKNLSRHEKIRFNDLWIRINTQSPNGMRLPHIAKADSLWATTTPSGGKKHYRKNNNNNNYEQQQQQYHQQLASHSTTTTTTTTTTITAVTTIAVFVSAILYLWRC